MKSKRWQMLRAFICVVAVLGVGVLVGPPGARADGYSKCVDGVAYGNCTLQGSTLVCEEMGECTSEGEDEPGSTACSGDLVVIECTDDGQKCQRRYECVEGVGWVLKGETCVPDPDCEEGEISACWGKLVGGKFEDPVCWEVPGSSTPCADLDWGTAGVQCAGEYGLEVSVGVPCQRVTRMPYPRGMVAAPNVLALSPSNPTWAQSWSQTLDYDECRSFGLSQDGRMIRNYKLGLAWGQMDGRAPYWSIEGAGGGYGNSVTAIWDYSSFGQPECGPGLTPGETLPAFRGHVYTYWVGYWRIVYELQRDKCECDWSWKCSTWGQGCSYKCDEDGDGEKDWGTKMSCDLCTTDENEDGIPDDECWETKDTGWVAFDLREFGYPTWYFTSGASGPVATALEPSPGCNGFCIPVIEVQGVIENPREP